MLKSLNKNLNKVYKFSGYIAALFLILVAVFILIGISSRIFNFYIRGLSEYSGYCMAAASFFALAGIISIFLMAMLLVTQLNSFYQAFVIVFAIILSTAGVQLGLFLTQSITSVLFTGLSVVALAGIVVNNNIVLVDTYNVLKRNSINLKEKSFTNLFMLLVLKKKVAFCRKLLEDFGVF